jgi:hypothetical protein
MPRRLKPLFIPGGYVVKDAAGQAVAYGYGRETRADTAKVLTMDEARRIASNIAKLPEVLAKKGKMQDKPAGSPWLPITTAPKDKTMILVHYSGIPIVAYLSGKQWLTLDLDELCPTHWMPLPPKPNGVWQPRRRLP